MASAQELHLDLDFPVPREVAVGDGTALFLCGWCFSARADLGALELLVDGQAQPVMAHGMPRSDVLRAIHPGLEPSKAASMESDPDCEQDPCLRSYRSGFWGMVRIPPEGREERELALRATLDGGKQTVSRLAAFKTTARAGQPADAGVLRSAAGPLVAVCMAIHEPPLDLLRRQLDSIRGQTHANWICLVSDDCSSPDRFEAVRKQLEGDPRFVLSRSPRRLGFYRNFERALSLAPAGADFVAMCDQDDSWHPDKLQTLIEEIGSAQLVYSDARVVSRDGELLSETYWSDRRNNHSDLSSLLMANAVTGAASLFRRELLDYALPFPPEQFGHFHDHWVAVTALTLGEIEFVDRPLYDYVQHRGAVLGHIEANRMAGIWQRLRSVRRDPRERVGHWRQHFFVDACRLMQFATILSMRCGPRMSAAKRRSIDRFLRAERSPLALGRLGLRAARELVGRPETLAAELMLLYGFAWRHMAVASTLGLERPRRRLRIDTRPPGKLVQRPGRNGPQAGEVRTVADKIAPLDLAPADNAPARVNILIPTIDLEHFFGGYIGKFNLARRLAERGARVRILTVDPVGALPPSWERKVESYSGLAGLFDQIEVEFGRESHGVEVSRSDRFVATTWWTAHIAKSTVESLGGGRFLYLIQEYEPFTFPMGTFAALASESYRFPHFALFSTELLRDYFRQHRFGVYAGGEAAGDRASASFQSAITPVEPPSASELAKRRTRRLLFYARPEAHAARNLFELGMLALVRAAEDGAFGPGWELHGIGGLGGGRRIELGAGAALELLPRRDQRAYAELLAGHDVGLALMYTPHPSLAPLEMSAAGMLTVTNSFENKTPQAMGAISENLITVEPTVAAVAAGLSRAVAGVEDYARRERGSAVRWSRDWRDSFDHDLMARVESFLEG